ncbi:MAG TPA: PP2C family protein-serine/threonine phosphatase [Anaerolineales bacterium]|nr:PP2C family protein-serine/threonine phosphatase [Anaerolineales bacterium]
MALEILERIETSLVEKREAVTKFLETASDAEREICLYEDDHCVQDHLHVIEASLEKFENHTLGLCEICHGYVEPSRLAMDYTASICLDHYSEAEMRRLESELELSQIVQRALLPQNVPVISGVEVAAFSRPADIIGGDYFDFFQFRDGTHGLVIADVSGHGVSAGMLMSSLQTALRTMAPDTDSPAEILERINRFYIHNVNFTTFVTVFLARFDPLNLELTYVNAGHNPPAVHRGASNDIHWLKPTAPAIGLAELFHPRIDSVRLSQGDSLLLYTDGVTEVVNAAGDEQFGYLRLADLLSQHAHQNAPDILQTVYRGASAFGNNRSLADDVTMVALKVLG